MLLPNLNRPELRSAPDPQQQEQRAELGQESFGARTATKLTVPKEQLVNLVGQIPRQVSVADGATRTTDREGIGRKADRIPGKTRELALAAGADFRTAADIGELAAHTLEATGSEQEQAQRNRREPGKNQEGAAQGIANEQDQKLAQRQENAQRRAQQLGLDQGLSIEQILEQQNALRQAKEQAQRMAELTGNGNHERNLNPIKERAAERVAGAQKEALDRIATGEPVREPRIAIPTVDRVRLQTMELRRQLHEAREEQTLAV